MERIPADLYLMDSWLIALRAEGKAKSTMEGYSTAVRQFIAWAKVEGCEPFLDRPTVTAFIAHILDAGAEPSTARARQLGLRQFSAWLADEGENSEDELLLLKHVKTAIKVTPELSDDQCTALLKACQGRHLRDVRDMAILRLMLETGARAGEVANLALDDVSLTEGTAVIRRTKTGRARTVPFGTKTAAAIDRYIRARRSHPLAHTPALWLGERGMGFGYEGLYSALGRRAELAGVRPFYPHLLRHTAASRWLAAGGSEQGLMTVAGWRNRSMLDRYTANSTEKRAADEARRLGLGDL